MIGNIRWYNPKKGFGFIRDEFTETDYFFHSSELPYGYIPIDGAEVEFTEKETERGWKATNIKAVTPEEL